MRGKAFFKIERETHLEIVPNVDFQKQSRRLIRERDYAVANRDYGAAAECCQTLFDLFHSTEDFNMCILHAKEWLKLASKLNGKERRKATNGAHLALGKAYLGTEQFDVAIEHLEEFSKGIDLLNSDEPKKTRERLFQARFYLGMAYFHRGQAAKERNDSSCNQDYSVAKDYFEQILETERDGDPIKRGKVMTFLGIMHLDLGNLPNAVGFHKRALKLARESEDLTAEMNAYENLSNAYRKLGNTDLCLEYLEKEKKLALKTSDTFRWLRAQWDSVVRYKEIFEFQKALAALQSYSEYATQMGLKKDVRNAEAEGRKLEKMIQMDKDVQLVTRALDSARKKNDVATEALNLRQRAHLRKQLNKFAEAIEDYRVLKATPKFQPFLEDARVRFKLFKDLADCYGQLGKFDEAISHQRKLLEIAPNQRTIAEETFRLCDYLAAANAPIENIAVAYRKCDQIGEELQDYEVRLQAQTSLRDLYEKLNIIDRRDAMERSLTVLRNEINLGDERRNTAESDHDSEESSERTSRQENDIPSSPDPPQKQSSPDPLRFTPRPQKQIQCESEERTKHRRQIRPLESDVIIACQRITDNRRMPEVSSPIERDHSPTPAYEANRSGRRRRGGESRELALEELRLKRKRLAPSPSNPPSKPTKAPKIIASSSPDREPILVESPTRPDLSARASTNIRAEPVSPTPRPSRKVALHRMNSSELDLPLEVTMGVTRTPEKTRVRQTETPKTKVANFSSSPPPPQLDPRQPIDLLTPTNDQLIRTPVSAKSPPPMKVLVQVDGQFYGIVCHNGPNGTPRTVGWLQAEAARRSKANTHKTPFIKRLTTVSKSNVKEVLNAGDLVHEVLSPHQEIFAEK